ncbi:hypothetical protein GCG54_00013452 [Colletotrichum gloeosporioides]|uniref:Heterokaryon incompatibility domain-containing protein n=1 Tax=Colletotrichum gloeosporioides TaxID=474922 RepID=A0A8H4FIC6_COLGL|nr:uncharacterized protein GCG54_00013452 [Colletotrichum gloeosporioides]KAF3803342.1 hypothetical protein GCG54_00013452 [Colletotrichum gloeosporioides]
MKYCNFCAKLTVELLSCRDAKFHPNLKSLKESAESGCAFCGVCWASVQANRIPPKYITELLNGERPSTCYENERNKPWYPSIWLCVEIIPKGLGPHCGTESRVSMTCGRGWSSGACWQVYLFTHEFADFKIRFRRKSEIGKRRLTSRRFAGSAAALMYPGWCIAADPDTSLQVSFIRSRLQEYCANNKSCAGPASLQMPTRVVDVGGNTRPRLLFTGYMREPYMALSYCWGPSKDTPRLTHDNFGTLLIQIPETILAKTHQEAIQLARVLGFQYLWIDALCIIQGDADDWAFESRRMEQIDGNANLTLVAARSADSRLGFSIPKTKQAQQHRPLPLSSSSSEVLYSSPHRRQTKGLSSTRGWCYQEEVLSKRMIIFAGHQIAYYRRTWSSWESGDFSLPHLKVRRCKPLGLWYTRIHAYMLCKLSNPHEIFAAIASIAKLAGEGLDSHYLAGLWECDIARGFLWKLKRHIASGCRLTVIRPSSTKHAPSPVIRAPSWSWASIEGPRKLQASSINEVIRLRPGAENDRWTTDESCDVQALHIPHRELCLIRKVAKAFVLRVLVRDYLCYKDSNWS